MAKNDDIGSVRSRCDCGAKAVGDSGLCEPCLTLIDKRMNTPAPTLSKQVIALRTQIRQHDETIRVAKEKVSQLEKLLKQQEQIDSELAKTA